MIDYKNWGHTPTKVTFKSSEDSKSTVYRPLEIQAFIVNNEYYEGAIVDSDVSDYSPGMISYSPKAETRKDTTFVRLIIDSDPSLYYHKNDQGNVNFYIKENGNFTWLERKLYSKKVDGRYYIAKNELYKNQLALALSGCDKSQLLAKNTEYTLKSMVKLFSKYNECIEEPYKIFYKTEKPIIKYQLITGATFTRLYFNGTSYNYEYLINGPDLKSNNLTFGFGLDYYFPRNLNKWVLHNELLFTSYDYEMKHTETINSSRSIINNTKIGNTHIKLSSMMRYFLYQQDFKWFLAGGFNLGLGINKTNTNKVTDTFYSPPRTKEEVAFTNFRNYEAGLQLGTGISYNKFSFEGRYERTVGPANQAFFGSGIKRIYFLIGYQIN